MFRFCPFFLPLHLFVWSGARDHRWQTLFLCKRWILILMRKFHIEMYLSCWSLRSVGYCNALLSLWLHQPLKFRYYNNRLKGSRAQMLLSKMIQFTYFNRFTVLLLLLECLNDEAIESFPFGCSFFFDFFFSLPIRFFLPLCNEHINLQPNRKLTNRELVHCSNGLKLRDLIILS